MYTIIVACIALILGICRTLASGFILSKYWGWFIVGHFTQTTMTCFTGVGVILFTSLMVHFMRITLKEDLDDEDVKPSWKAVKKYIDDIAMRSIGRAIFRFIIEFPLLYLVGYLWHHFL